jgi:RimJ/RimL family protein N-acetyltransferase
MPIDPLMLTKGYVAARVDRHLRSQSQKPRTGFVLAAADKHSDQFVGEGGLTVYSFPARRGGIGWGVTPDQVCRGFATEIGRTLLRLAFETLNLHRVEAQCRSENHASRRIMAKLGMREEGIFRDNLFVRGGMVVLSPKLNSIGRMDRNDEGRVARSPIRRTALHSAPHCGRPTTAAHRRPVSGPDHRGCGSRQRRRAVSQDQADSTLPTTDEQNRFPLRNEPVRATVGATKEPHNLHPATSRSKCRRRSADCIEPTRVGAKEFGGVRKHDQVKVRVCSRRPARIRAPKAIALTFTSACAHAKII